MCSCVRQQVRSQMGLACTHRTALLGVVCSERDVHPHAQSTEPHRPYLFLVGLLVAAPLLLGRHGSLLNRRGERGLLLGGRYGVIGGVFRGVVSSPLCCVWAWVVRSVGGGSMGPPAKRASQPLPPSNNRLIDRCRSRGQCQPNHALDRLTFYAD